MQTTAGFPNTHFAEARTTGVFRCAFLGGILWAATLSVLSAQSLQILSPQTLELTYTFVVQSPTDAPRPLWLGVGGATNPPLPADFQVVADGQPVEVLQVGSVRRAASAETKRYQATVETRVFLRLALPLAPGAALTVNGPEVTNAVAGNQDQRPSQVIHVNPIGFTAQAEKRAYLGYWLGDLGELVLSNWVNAPFELRRESDGSIAFAGTLTARPDVGFNAPSPYQQVLEAEFSALTDPGRYVLRVAGLGQSVAFRVGPEVAAAAARTYALGLLHQRSGFDLTWPETRFTRTADHTNAVDVPSGSHPTNPLLAASTSDYANNPRHTAPQLSNVTNSLYPFLRTGPVDASGGHHDAGDYSKYTINSAQLVHELAFAARYFPGAGGLDNLGIPESGDGLGDLWQMAAWEARFLAKLQDTDGGFSFLVYPQARRYEDNVMPEDGDPQVLWPKNTSATAAATAALAELAAAPGFAEAFPQEALQFRNQALLGWSFLTQAIAEHGRDGSYQKLTHYGDVFMHDDELCWAAAALFVMTGDPQYETQLKLWMPDPTSRSVRRWTWWRLYGSYGNALRCLSLGGPDGDAAYRELCRQEVLRGGLDQVTRAGQNAYGLSFPVESKRFYSAGWYFGSMAAFDILAALQVSPSSTEAAGLRAALWSNLGYEWGANPGDRTYVTGWGNRSPLNPVSQQALNDAHQLPPSGQMVGNLQTGMGWLNLYATNLSRLTYPSDSLTNGLRYPLYDRFTDLFNTQTEFTIVEQGAGVAVTAALLGMEESQPPDAGRGVGATLAGSLEFWNLGGTNLLTLSADGVDFTGATVLWEWPGGWTHAGASLPLKRPVASAFSVEAEAILPDGRRAYGALPVPSINQAPLISLESTNLSLTLPTSSLKLSATVVDDEFTGFPLLLEWSLVSGPSIVNFTDPNRAVTHVSLREPGIYRLRLTAGDTEFSTEQDVFLNVTGTAVSGTELIPGNQVLLYRFNTSANQVTNAWPLSLAGNAAVGVSAGYWGESGGSVLRTRDLGDQAQVSLPDLIEATNAAPVVLEARMLARQFKAYSVSDTPVLSLRQNWDSSLEILDGKWNTTRRPSIKAGGAVLLSSAQWPNQIPLNTWTTIRMVYEPSANRARLFLNGVLINQVTISLNASRSNPFILVIGNFDGDVDELAVWRQ